MKENLYGRIHEIEERHWWFRGRRAVIRGLLEHTELPPSARILDAGCGTGRNLQEYARLGRVAGAEPSQTAVDFCRERGYLVELAPVERLPFADGSFDLVCASDVLEHIEDDGAALRELRRVTGGQGFLMATVPAYMWMWSPHDESHQHVRRYTRSRLLERAEANGWRVSFATYFNSALLGPIAVVRALQRLRPAPRRTDYDLTPAPLNAVLELPMRAEARLVAAGRRLPAGLSVGLVCRAAE